MVLNWEKLGKHKGRLGIPGGNPYKWAYDNHGQITILEQWKKPWLFGYIMDYTTQLYGD